MIPIVPYIPPGDIERSPRFIGFLIFILSMIIGLGGFIAFFSFVGNRGHFFVLMIFALILLIVMIPIVIIVVATQNNNFSKSKADQRRISPLYRSSRAQWSPRMNADTKSYCSSCGSVVEDKDLYCMECGSRLD